MSVLVPEDDRIQVDRMRHVASDARRDYGILMTLVNSKCDILRSVCSGMSLLAIVSGMVTAVVNYRYRDTALLYALDVLPIMASGIVCMTAFSYGRSTKEARREAGKLFALSELATSEALFANSIRTHQQTTRRLDDERRRIRAKCPRRFASAEAAAARNQPSNGPSSAALAYRRNGRIVPRNDRARVTLHDGTIHEATIANFSQSGAALVIALNLKIGQQIMVGRRAARIVRNYSKGVAVAFAQLIPPDEFDENLVL
jgi:hypothetical protein